MSNLVIVDYGMGNLGSIANMLKKAGHKALITSNPEQIAEANRLILPGVGAFDSGITNLSELNLLEILSEKVLVQKTPILGICLGMQLMAKSSEEGTLPGLGWIDAEVVRFKSPTPDQKLRIPHMGWNLVYLNKESVLFKEMFEEPRFYFVHSYHLSLKATEDLLCTTEYGYRFHSAFERGNIAGVQFHPEKSHKFGLKLLKNFTENFNPS